MKQTITAGMICAALSLPLNAVAAPDVNDVTLEIIENSAERPDNVMERIELPDEASEIARDRAEHGLETANEARNKDDDDGAEHARDEDAREHMEEAEDHREEVEDHKNELEDTKDETDDHEEDREKPELED